MNTSTNARHAWWNRHPEHFIRFHALPSPLLMALLRHAGHVTELKDQA